MTDEVTQSEVKEVNTETATPIQPRLNWKETLSLLYEKFPHCFIEGRDKKPLQIGVSEILTERLKDYPVSEKILKKVLWFYTAKPSYLYAFKEGAMRVDLEGNPVEPITEEQIAHARTRLKEMAARNKKSREQKEQKQKFTEMVKVQEEEIKILLDDANKKLAGLEKKSTLSLKKKTTVKDYIK